MTAARAAVAAIGPGVRRLRLARGIGVALHAAWLTALWTAVGAIVALAALVSLTPLLGYRPFTVLTGSMAPAIEAGSIVFTRPIAPGEARVGEVITFPDPTDHRRLITHRLRGLSIKSGRAYMVTRGDANDAPERWNVPLDEEIGRVDYQAPKLGYARAWVGGKVGAMGATAIVVLWGGLALLEIWRPRGRRGGSPEAEKPAEEASAP